MLVFLKFNILSNYDKKKKKYMVRLKKGEDEYFGNFETPHTKRPYFASLKTNYNFFVLNNLSLDAI